MMKAAVPALSLLAVLALAGCRLDTPPAPAAAPATGATADTALGRTIRQASDQVRNELASHNIGLSSDGQPKAEITPQGELLIGGSAVAITPEQRALLLAYRAEVVEIATAGIDIGAEGANLGLRAAGQALRSVLSGNPEQAGARVEAEVEAEAGAIKAAAHRLCQRIPALREQQQALAASLPAFAPYASIDVVDASQCEQELAAAPAPR